MTDLMTLQKSLVAEVVLLPLVLRSSNVGGRLFCVKNTQTSATFC